MICPECGKLEDKVVETRESKDGKYIRRRRECINCKKRYTTYEKLENIPLLIKKKMAEEKNLILKKFEKEYIVQLKKGQFHIKK